MNQPSSVSLCLNYGDTNVVRLILKSYRSLKLLFSFSTCSVWTVFCGKYSKQCSVYTKCIAYSVKCKARLVHYLACSVRGTV